MADVYCDMDLSTGLNNGTSWANAYQTFSGLLGGLAAGGGDDAWIKGSENVSGDLTVALGGTRSNPNRLYGVKSGTTAEPPTNSDLAILGTDTLPQMDRSGSGDSHKFTGFGYIFGLYFISGGTKEMQSGEIQIRFEGCNFKCGDGTSGTASIEVGHESPEDGTVVLEFLNCDFTGSDNTDDSLFECKRRAYVRVIGGSVDGNWLQLVYGGSSEASARLEFIGVDLSAHGSRTMVLVDNDQGQDVIFSECRLGASYTLVSGTWNSAGIGPRVVAENCTEGTTDWAQRALDYHEEHHAGTIEINKSTYRAANDGDDDYSYELTPTASRLKPPYFRYEFPEIWVYLTAGGLTTITLHMMWDSATTPTDIEMGFDLITPSEAANPNTYEAQFNTTRPDPLVAASNLPTTTGAWTGAPGTNTQVKPAISVTPTFDGWARIIPWAADDSANDIFVCPKAVVA